MHVRRPSRSFVFTYVALACLGAAVPLAVAAVDKKLPPGTRHGPIDRLQQYPKVSLATAAQRAAAEQLRRETRTATRLWRNPTAAAAAGFSIRLAVRRPGDRSAHWFHSENHTFLHDEFFLDPYRVETLIYANVPDRPLVLIGVMFALHRGMRGPTPGGPITRWHTHWVCARGDRRGVAALRDGSCPRGSTGRQGSEMLHLWFTRDLRSAYAINAPEPELCIAGLLPRRYCRAGTHHGHHAGKRGP